ncbi:hypothetical protein ACA910_014415 [Epithemia clementina (nom. ined.)]
MEPVLIPGPLVTASIPQWNSNSEENPILPSSRTLAKAPNAATTEPRDMEALPSPPAQRNVNDDDAAATAVEDPKVAAVRLLWSTPLPQRPTPKPLIAQYQEDPEDCLPPSPVVTTSAAAAATTTTCVTPTPALPAVTTLSCSSPSQQEAQSPSSSWDPVVVTPAGASPQKDNDDDDDDDDKEEYYSQYHASRDDSAAEDQSSLTPGHEDDEDDDDDEEVQEEEVVASLLLESMWCLWKETVVPVLVWASLVFCQGALWAAWGLVVYSLWWVGGPQQHQPWSMVLHTALQVNPLKVVETALWQWLSNYNHQNHHGKITGSGNSNNSSRSRVHVLFLVLIRMGLEQLVVPLIGFDSRLHRGLVTLWAVSDVAHYSWQLVSHVVTVLGWFWSTRLAVVFGWGLVVGDAATTNKQALQGQEGESMEVAAAEVTADETGAATQETLPKTPETAELLGEGNMAVGIRTAATPRKNRGEPKGAASAETETESTPQPVVETVTEDSQEEEDNDEEEEEEDSNRRPILTTSDASFKSCHQQQQEDPETTTVQSRPDGAGQDDDKGPSSKKSSLLFYTRIQSAVTAMREAMFTAGQFGLAAANQVTCLVLPLGVAVCEMSLLATAAYTATRPLELWMACMGWPLAFYPRLFQQALQSSELAWRAVVQYRNEYQARRTKALRQSLLKQPEARLQSLQFFDLTDERMHEDFKAKASSASSSSSVVVPLQKKAATTTTTTTSPWDDYLERLYLLCCNSVLMVAWARVGRVLLHQAWSIVASTGQPVQELPWLSLTRLTHALGAVDWTQLSACSINLAHVLDTALTCSLLLEVLNAIISWTRYSTRPAAATKPIDVSSASTATTASTRRQEPRKIKLPQLQVLLLLAALRMALQHFIVTPLMITTTLLQKVDSVVSVVVLLTHLWTVTCWSLGDTLRFACFVWTDVSEFLVWTVEHAVSSSSSHHTKGDHQRSHSSQSIGSPNRIKKGSHSKKKRGNHHHRSPGQEVNDSVMDDWQGSTIVGGNLQSHSHDDEGSVMSMLSSASSTTTHLTRKMFFTTKATFTTLLLYVLKKSIRWAPWIRYTLVEPVLFPLTALGEWCLLVQAACLAERPLELWLIAIVWPVFGLWPLWRQLWRQRQVLIQQQEFHRQQQQRYASWKRGYGASASLVSSSSCCSKSKRSHRSTNKTTAVTSTPVADLKTPSHKSWLWSPFSISMPMTPAAVSPMTPTSPGRNYNNNSLSEKESPADCDSPSKVALSETSDGKVESSCAGAHGSILDSAAGSIPKSASFLSQLDSTTVTGTTTTSQDGNHESSRTEKNDENQSLKEPQEGVLNDTSSEDEEEEVVVVEEDVDDGDIHVMSKKIQSGSSNPWTLFRQQEETTTTTTTKTIVTTKTTTSTTPLKHFSMARMMWDSPRRANHKLHQEAVAAASGHGGLSFEEEESTAASTLDTTAGCHHSATAAAPSMHFNSSSNNNNKE